MTASLRQAWPSEVVGELGAVEELRDRLRGRLGRQDEPRLAVGAHAARLDHLGGEPDDGRDDRRAAHVRRDKRALLDAVLEHGHDRVGPTERAEEAGGALGLVRLDREQHDIGLPRHGGRIHQHRPGHDLLVDGQRLVRRAAAQQQLDAAPVGHRGRGRADRARADDRDAGHAAATAGAKAGPSSLSSSAISAPLPRATL